VPRRKRVCGELSSRATDRKAVEIAAIIAYDLKSPAVLLSALSGGVGGNQKDGLGSCQIRLRSER
jgi:hypothetical protein